MDWIHLAQDRDKWRALLNIVMHLPAALNAMGNCAIRKRQYYSYNEIYWLEMGTFQDMWVTEYEGVTSIPRKYKTPKRRMLDRESPRTHG